ncbi:MAG: NYN domain-containing protein [Lachnospiraceae bacterium]|nr:NYN domain-containing protein [Lachnospiraceae bacterium]
MEDKKIALLIDSDNVSHKYIDGILNELAQYGIVTYRRIYGDFTSAANAGWAKKLLAKSIIPIQQFANTSGKNATDSALIIDAMDLLYTDNTDGFCIVSSDSDFTRLASRLRESGKSLIGMGEKKTPDSFRAACTVFTELENLLEDEDEKPKRRKAERVSIDRDAVVSTIIDILTKNENNGKMTTDLSEIGSKLRNIYPDFDVRNFGYSQLSKFLSDVSSLKVETTGHHTVISFKEESTDIGQEIESIVRKNGGKAMALSTLGQEIRKKFPDFDVKMYGYSQLYKFVDSLPNLAIQGEKADRKVVYVPRH